MMTRQARSSAAIMGFDTHMILGTVPAPPPIRQNAHQAINRTSRHYAEALAPTGGKVGQNHISRAIDTDVSRTNIHEPFAARMRCHTEDG